MNSNNFGVTLKKCLKFSKIVFHRNNGFYDEKLSFFNRKSKSLTIQTKLLNLIYKNCNNILTIPYNFRELNTSSKISRGPPDFSPSSRLHLDMLLNRDEKISFGDYLNIDAKERW